MCKEKMQGFAPAAMLLALFPIAMPAAEAPAAAHQGMGHAVVEHAMNDDPVISKLMMDQLEWRNTSGDDALAWNGSWWIGRDEGRMLVRSEGEAIDGDVEHLRAELLWWRPLAPFWNVVGGLRQDAGIGPGRTYGLVGIEGLAPGWFHVEADLFAGERGQVGTRLESSYEIRLTNRLILSPRVELTAYAKDDEATGIGSGLSSLDAGLRLRYEIRREFAPYIGVGWTGSFGDTADLARDAGAPVRDTFALAGLRFWY